MTNPFMDELKPGSISAPDNVSRDDATLAASVSEESPKLPTKTAHTIFFGPDGLRTGWRLLLYFLIAAAIASLLVMCTRFLFPHSSPRNIWVAMTTELTLLIAAISSALIMARIEKRPFDEYGLPRGSAFGKMFWIGIVWGFAALSLLMFSLRGAGVFSFGGLALHGERVFKFALFWSAFFLLVGLFEEFFLRGYSQFTLSRGMGFWPAAILLSFVFGAIHLGNPGEEWIGALTAALIGLFFCLTLYRTGTLWFAVGFHASWDWGESFFYSVPDSGQVSPGHLLNSSFHGSRWLTGGKIGPEGSVLAFVIIALVWVAFSRLYPEVRYGKMTVAVRE